ncbi:MAG: ETC complex I subunit [Rhodospirillaceae bacterium]|jgi:hypothetical protein|nr:ETC complex I subunit [Rhodospirillaceae bacterium]MBT6139275.1 ETC complex I subunit [Rhodospirillaceae bacterium]
MTVRIYQPTKTAMQSGRGKTNRWVLEYEPQTARRPEPLMGWVGAGDTKAQIKLRFDTRDEAIAYAERKGMEYVVREPRKRDLQIKVYADNFSSNRRVNWTH